MRLPRIQFTLRRMMVGVAVLSIPMGATHFLRQREIRMRRWERAYFHKNEAYQIWCFQLSTPLRGIGLDEYGAPFGDSPASIDSAKWVVVLEKSPPETRAELERAKLKHEYHKRMQEKWDKFMRYPWQPVPPDPPPPP